MRFNNSRKRGFTLVELLVAIGIFVLVTTALYQGYRVSLQAVRLGRIKAIASALANEQFEIMRNLPYTDVGLVNGAPSGKIPRFQTLVRDGISFSATTTIRNTQDSFDGLATGTVPIDTAPADYKTVAIEIGCEQCIPRLIPLEFTTTIVPRALETTTTNGSLFIKVFNATGQPIQDAVVTIQNTSTSPTINIVDNTDVNGKYELVDIPPGNLNYQVSVTKSGFTTDRTYSAGTFGSSTIVNPHKTIVQQKVTQASFAIDAVSSLQVSSLTTACAVAASMPYTISGTKLVATAPSVLKTSQNRNTGASGIDQISNLEWDTYNIYSTDSTRFVSGTIPLLPVAISPNSSNVVNFILTPKVPSALLISLKDANTLLPLSDVTVTLTKSGYSDVRTTGQGYWRQADWSGGSGQANWVDETKYISSDGNVNSATAGSLRLATAFGNYVTDGSLVSSSFDAGTTSSFYNITWQPQSQPGGAGANALRFQIASNNDNATWNFIGPDGTAGSYYSSSNETISVHHVGNRYIRYKVFLHTDSVAVTPTLSEIALTFSSQCAPPGQVYFDDLSSGTYTISASKTGYTSTNVNVTVPSNGFASTSVMMTP